MAKSRQRGTQSTAWARRQDTPASKNEGAARDNFQQAIDHYAPIVGAMKARNKLLSVTAVVVANLCVAYIMNERNHEAEDLMKHLEREEELSLEAEPDKRVRRAPTHIAASLCAYGATACAWLGRRRTL